MCEKVQKAILERVKIEEISLELKQNYNNDVESLLKSKKQNSIWHFDPVKDTKVDNKHPGRRYSLVWAKPSKSIPWHPEYMVKVFEALDPANDINMIENHPGRLTPHSSCPCQLHMITDEKRFEVLWWYLYS